MKQIFKKMDKPLLIMMVLYSIIGLILVMSASSVIAVMQYGESPYYYFIRQLIFYVTAYAVGFVFIVRFPIKNYKKLMPILLFGLIAALLFLLLYGSVTNSARSWIGLGTFGVQPSEFGKLILILYLGIFFGNYQYKKVNQYDFLRPLLYCIIVCTLIAMQPDFGTAAITAGIVMFTFFAIPISGNSIVKILKLCAIGVAIVAIIFLVTDNNFFTKEQLSRFTYKEPCSRYTQKTGYQVCNGFIAINNGGLVGKGLGNSTQKYLYLPEAYTDFIFPIAVEEFGVAIGILLIFGYMFILARILWIAKRASNLRNSIISYGVFAYITLHLLINFLGILALIPLTGVPVPFLSYGGSITLSVVFAMFLVQRVVIETKNDRHLREIKEI